ncbi:MAG: MOSC domain-containing protein [Spirochaetaceae bacterium]|nr:MAG: MOSC domain-containing protein [Spirochaetaceae bacterium]
MQLHVSRIAVYPLKSCAPLYPEREELVETGFRYDRCWMVADETGRFLTQREHPEMARVRAVPAPQGLTLIVPGREPIEVPLRGGRAAGATVWDDRCDVVDQGDLAAELLGSFLGRPCRLVRMRPGFRRELGSSYGGPQEMSVSFADSAPLLLTSEASLADLNGRLAQPVPMDRFRPNIVVSGGKPYQEDRWRVIRIGGVTLRLVKDCIRCAIVTVDQTTGEKGAEPLETLDVHRPGPKGPRFGMKVVHQGTGAIGSGDTVEVLH